MSDNRTEGISNLQNSLYVKYAYTGFEPNYPSINYSACKPIKTYSRETLPYIKVSEYNDEIPLINLVEYSWFNNGISIFVLPTHKFTYINRKLENNSYKTIDEIVNELVKDYYNIDDDKILEYIVNLYSVESDWEYLSDVNVEDYLYTIKLKLK